MVYLKIGCFLWVMHAKRSKDEEAAAAEIMHTFKYYFRDQWMPGHLFDGKSRIWVKVFNDLIKQGFIRRKKKSLSFQYKWVAQFPEGL